MGLVGISEGSFDYFNIIVISLQKIIVVSIHYLQPSPPPSPSATLNTSTSSTLYHLHSPPLPRSTPGISAFDFSTQQGKPFKYFSFGAAVTEVQLDTLTGDHTVGGKAREGGGGVGEGGSSRELVLHHN